MDTKYKKEKRKVALIIDNCPAHPTIDNLKSIELIFLPPNTTLDSSQWTGSYTHFESLLRSFSIAKAGHGYQ